jgi:hypothetical protein
MKATYEFKNIPFDEKEDLQDYEGSTSVSSMYADSIDLNPNELILFD